MNTDNPPCSINFCVNTAVNEEVAETEHWRFTVRYCSEHFRELSNGTPLGPLGLDAAHVSIESLGETELKVPSMQPSPTA